MRNNNDIALEADIDPNVIFLSNTLIMILPFVFLTYHLTSIYSYHEDFTYWIRIVPASLLILLIPWVQKKTSLPFDSVAIIAKVYFIFILAYALTPLLLATPFPFIDKQLLHIDSLMHFHLTSVMNFTIEHPTFYRLMSYAYSNWIYELLLLLILLYCFGEKYIVNHIIHVIQIALFITSICFYFFPAFGPLTLLHDPFTQNYSFAEHAQYQAIHHGLSPTIHGYYYAGFVSFPSMHCFIASTAIYAIIITKKFRWFLLPLIPMYLTIIASTLFLGEHYLIDLLASECLLFLIIFSRRFILRLITIRY